MAEAKKEKILGVKGMNDVLPD
ncbi:MAG: hypothetical protein RL083_382, partial [Pseudomonadota bacterium]